MCISAKRVPSKADNATPVGASARRTIRGPPRLVARTVLIAAVTLSLTGCATVGIEHQRLVSKPNMQFSEVRAFGEPTRLASQLEPGRVVTGGAQASVCTSCR